MAESAGLIEVTHDGPVTVFTLGRPPANALGMPLVEALQQALDEFESDEEHRVLVLASAISGFFAAGADLKYISTLDADGFADYRTALRTPIERIAHLGRASIAAMDGVAFGGGLELAMATSIRLLTPAARVGLPEVRLGLLAGVGGTQRLTHLLGPSRSLRLQLTGDEIDGPTAAAWGLGELVEADSAVPAALAMAQRIGRHPPAAVASILACVDAAVHLPAEGIDVEGEHVIGLFAGGHADAGIARFLERSR